MRKNEYRREGFISGLRLTMRVGLMAGGLLAASGLCAQTPAAATYDATTKVFRLDGAGVTYAFGVNEVNELQPVYWGATVAGGDPLPTPHTQPEAASFDSPATTTPKEYAGWGGGLFTEPALKMTFPDGNRDLVLKYVSHTIHGQEVVVTVKDIERDVVVRLRYTIDAGTGIVGRSAEIVNKTRQPVVIEAAAAAQWNLPRGNDYSLRYLSGRWAGETQLQQQAIRPGTTVLESRRGSTGHQNNPWFAIERGQHDEEAGDVWFGALAWSGSWRITVEQDQLQQIRVTGGFNPFDFGYKLAPGQTLETPVFYGGYAQHGVGEASRLLHRFELAAIVPEKPSPRPRPVLYNSWEATGFSVDEPGQMALAEKAASVGVERFVMDDGWFGQRKDDHAGLGDWYVNPQKFPHGLKPLIGKVQSLGMDFGLWVEPEMVNPDSDLYRKHPDWVLHFTGRPRSESRNQLVLNLARPDVRAYVFGFLDELLKQNPGIAFLKWDYNRNWSEPGWPAVAPDEQKSVYVAYTRNLYSILSELRAKHAGLEIESCSGGGGRVDLGILGLTDEVWPSDNTDPFDRLKIQDGFTYAYTPGVMMAWVTDSPSWANNRTTSLSYRFLSSMQGSLGVGANLNHWTPEEFATAKALIAAYKGIRETVQHGSLYRLVSPRDGSETSVTESVSVDKKQAALFTFLHSSQMNYPYPRVYLRGLDAAARYRVTAIAGALTPGQPETASGSYWMEHGVDVSLRGDFQAAAFRFDRVE